MEERVDEQIAELQAKLDELEQESIVCGGTAADWHLVVEKQNARVAELEAKLNAYDETHMLLPVDTIGIPIHVGDLLECHANGYDGKFEVFAIGDNVVVGNHDIEFVMRNPTDWYHVARYCRHVEQRTIEDVLLEFSERVCKSGHQWGLDASDVVPEYAAELRELMEVDA